MAHLQAQASINIVGISGRPTGEYRGKRRDLKSIESVHRTGSHEVIAQRQHRNAVDRPRGGDATRMNERQGKTYVYEFAADAFEILLAR